MPFDRRKADRFLTTGKLKLESHEGRRHTQYLLRVGDKAIALPYKLTLSRGTGDITQRNLKGLATDLGLSKKGIEEGIRCQVGRRCIILCMCAMYLTNVVKKHEDDGVTFNEDWLNDIAVSIDMILDSFRLDEKTKTWAKIEAAELRRWLGHVRHAGEYDGLKQTTKRWQEIVSGDGKKT